MCASQKVWTLRDTYQDDFWSVASVRVKCGSYNLNLKWFLTFMSHWGVHKYLSSFNVQMWIIMSFQIPFFSKWCFTRFTFIRCMKYFFMFCQMMSECKSFGAIWTFVWLSFFMNQTLVIWQVFLAVKRFFTYRTSIGFLTRMNICN